MTNTRLMPTANGRCHLGHLYLALVNSYHAHSTGGRFTLIIDDNQASWVALNGAESMHRFAKLWIEDMEWAGIKFDMVIYQSERREWLMDELRRLNYDGEPEHAEYPYVPITIDGKQQYPFEDFLTVEKVLMDSLAGVDLVIRGEDLHCEYCLYQSMWNKYITRHGGAKPPDHVYLPRLRTGGSPGELDTVSKTNGTFKVDTYREQGWTKAGIETLLRESCLVDPYEPWDYHNVKREPVIERRVWYVNNNYGMYLWRTTDGIPVH